MFNLDLVKKFLIYAAFGALIYFFVIKYFLGLFTNAF